jgi:hypothetical protein
VAAEAISATRRTARGASGGIANARGLRRTTDRLIPGSERPTKVETKIMRPIISPPAVTRISGTTRPASSYCFSAVNFTMPAGQLRFIHAGPGQFSTFASAEWIEKTFRQII